MESFLNGIAQLNTVLWHDAVLYTVLATGVLFTFWSKFCQFRALTHGVAVLRGKYDKKNDPGAINHFQALSAALSATVGLGNIGGVALAIALGGPGAVFWMWVIGLVGMALKTTEVVQSMLYRNTTDPDNPRGGPMWVVRDGFRKINPALGTLGSLIGGFFCITLLLSAVTGGNMFQAWNVAEVTHSYFPSVPRILVGMVMTLIVGMVIIGGIKRIGSVTGRLVPFMCGLYLLAALYVILSHLGEVPAMFKLIISSAFSPAEAGGSFLGGTAGYAFLWGMKRALFSSEVGQGSAPIAHAAAKTDEPVREGIVAGLEPFIDTLVVCTLTTLVILLSGAWNRGPEALFERTPALTHPTRLIVLENGKDKELLGIVIEKNDREIKFLNGNPVVGEAAFRSWPISDVQKEEVSQSHWIPELNQIPSKDFESKRISGDWAAHNTVFMIAQRSVSDSNTGRDLYRIHGTLVDVGKDALVISWKPLEAEEETTPVLRGPEIYNDFVGAALTGHAFDRVTPGLGMWLVTVSCWLFAISTLISWSYYGEQGIVYLLGSRAIMPFKVVYCLLILIATCGVIRTDIELDSITALGTGVMLWANIPIMWIFGRTAMKAYSDYMARLDGGQMTAHASTSVVDMVEGRD